ncbi:MAG TPA: lytic transglycosylase domain-containing protein, partial [Candidatus Norongarragalinales archaeon]|nr:lytic transglycosylase domain-containing protein [Candidatus Norongarragalinales archaeon]
FRGVKGLPIDHMGIVQGFDPKKGLLFTFEQSYVKRQNEFCQNVGAGAKPRIWCLPGDPYDKERDFFDKNICKQVQTGEDNDLDRFAGGIRLNWHRDKNAYDVWSPEEFKPENTRIVPIVECVRETQKACPSLGRVKYVSETNDPKEYKRYKKSTWAKADPDCIFKKASQLSQISLTLLQSVMAQESAGRQFATSTYKDPSVPGGIDHARGYTQLIEPTAAGMGIGMKQIFDPYYNICGGVHYFSGQLKKYKVVECALAAYNGGPASIQNALAGYNGPPGPAKKAWMAKQCRENAKYSETRHYVQVIADDWHSRI